MVLFAALEWLSALWESGFDRESLSLLGYQSVCVMEAEKRKGCQMAEQTGDAIRHSGRKVL